MDTYLTFSDDYLKEIIKYEYKFIDDICKNLNIEQSSIIDLGSGHGNNTLALSFFF